MSKLKISSELSLPIDAVTQTMAIVARKRVGKTYTASVIVEELIENNCPVVILDPTGAWWGLRASADGKSEGYPVTIIGGSHADVPLEETAGKVIADLVVDHPGFYIIDSSQVESDAANQRFATDFAKRFYFRKEQHRFAMTLVIDEADVFIPQNPFGEEKRMLHAFDVIVRRGGIRGIGCIVITQRPAVLNKNVLTQCETLIALQISGSQDVDAIEHWTRIHGTKEQKSEFLSSIGSLQMGVAWFWSPSWLQEFRQVHIRTRRTFNSSATPKAGEKIVQPKKLAEIDLEKLGQEIKATIEKQKASDPEILNKRIRDLERELKSRPDQVAEVKEVPVYSEEESKRLKQLVDWGKNFSDTFSANLRELTVTAQAIHSEIIYFTDISKSKFKAAPLRERNSALSVTAVGRSAVISRTLPTPSNSDSEIGKGAVTVLKAIASSDDGVSDSQIGVLTGYKKTSRTVFKQKLSSQGFIAKGGRGYLATNEGISFLGSDYEPLPTGIALRDHYLKTLGGGELNLFRVYVDSYPNEVSNEEIMEKCNYGKTSVIVFKQRLRARNLIDGNKANPNLFNE